MGPGYAAGPAIGLSQPPKSTRPAGPSAGAAWHPTSPRADAASVSGRDKAVEPTRPAGGAADVGRDGLPVDSPAGTNPSPGERAAASPEGSARSSDVPGKTAEASNAPTAASARGMAQDQAYDEQVINAERHEAETRPGQHLQRTGAGPWMLDMAEPAAKPRQGSVGAPMATATRASAGAEPQQPPQSGMESNVAGVGDDEAAVAIDDTHGRQSSEQPGFSSEPAEAGADPAADADADADAEAGAGAGAGGDARSARAEPTSKPPQTRGGTGAEEGASAEHPVEMLDGGAAPGASEAPSPTAMPTALRADLDANPISMADLASEAERGTSAAEDRAERSRLIEDLAAQRDAKRAEVDAAASLALASIGAVEAQAVATIRGRVDGLIAQSDQRHEALAARVAAAVQAAVGAVEANAATAGKRAAAVRTQEAGRLRTETSRRETELRAAAHAEAKAPSAFTEQEVGRADRVLRSDAERAQAVGQRVAARYPGADDKRYRQRAAARKMAADSAADINAKRPDLAAEIRAKGREFEGGYGPIAEDAIQAVETELVSVNAALERLAAPAPGLIEQARARAVARLQALQAGVLSALSRSRLRLRQSLVVERGRAVAALRATVRTARRRLRQRGQIATIALDNVIVEVRGAIGGEAIPFLPGVRDVVARAESALSLHASSFDVDGDVLVDETHRSVADVVQTAEAGLQARAGSALAQADASAQRGLAQAGEVQASARARSDAILAQLEGRLKSHVDGFLGNVDSAFADVRSRMERLTDQFKADLTPQVDEALSEARKPLTDDLNTRATAAAEKAGESQIWQAVTGILEGLGQLLVGLLIFVGVALLIFALLPVSLGAAMAIAFGGLLVIGLVGNFMQRRDDLRDAGLDPNTAGNLAIAAGMSILDTVGATAIGEAITGIDSHTGQKIDSTRDRFKRGTVGVGTVVMLLLGVRGAKGMVRPAPGSPLARPGGVKNLPRNLADFAGWAKELPGRAWEWLSRRFGRRAEGESGTSEESGSSTEETTPEAEGGRTGDETVPEEGQESGGGRGGRTDTQVPGLVEGIDPATPPPGGWRFSDTVTTTGHVTEVATEVTAPDGSTGSMARSHDAQTGQFSMDYAFLDQIPNRWVQTTPEMVPGRGTPLETYMTMRQMRILEQQAGAVFSGPRVVHLSTIINVRTCLQLGAREAALGRQMSPAEMNTAILETHSVKYAENSIVQTGGRIKSAEVTRVKRMRAGDIAEQPQLEAHGVSADTEVPYAFDIDLNVVPSGQQSQPGSAPGSAPGALVPDQDDN
jgi:hypothetical protein